MAFHARIFLPLLLVLGLTACTVNLISAYDPTTDKMVTQLQHQVDSMLLNIKENVGTRQANYRYYQKQYDQIFVNTAELQTRTEAIANNQLTIRQVKLLQDALLNLQKVHKIGFKSVRQVNVMQQAIDSIFLSILKLELAKKRGNHE